MAIYFYRVNEKPYGCFSNFSGHGFELDGLWWPTVEHYYQAQKCAGTSYIDAVRRARTPMQAKIVGNDRSRLLRADWEQVKVDIMRQAVLRKFEVHDDIREILLATGEEVLVENSPTDYYWGCGIRKTGKNMLGKVLMEVREIFRRRERGEAEPSQLGFSFDTNPNNEV